MNGDFSHSLLGTEILKGVSRSFYLSLRQLPQGMRDGAGIGYLLARASDTIADTTALAVSERGFLLDEFAAAVESGGLFVAPTILLESCTAGERILLDRCKELVACLGVLPPEVQALVRGVFQEIVSGQRLDLQRFGDSGVAMAIRNHEELLDYCDRVAGSVGEFWTHLGFYSEGEKFCDASKEQMIEWGRNYGRGLQLVNILRDLPEDLRAGRCYLPDLSENARIEQVLVAHRQWSVIASQKLADGLSYASALRGRRLRAASVLPALLAQETMEKMRAASWADLEKRVKIGRFTVFRCFAEALLF